MGRPLNKKYFGNRNIGTTGTTDDGIGGEGVASVDNPVAGSINIVNAYPTFPALTASAPTIANGVTATFAVTWEVDTVTIAGGTGYTAGTITSITGLDGYANVPTRFTITAPGGVPAFNAFTNRGEYTNINGTGIATWAVVRAPGDGAAQATIKFRVKSIAVVNKGSGYVSVPSLSWGTLSGTSPSGNTPTLTTDSGSPGSATNQENAIKVYAYIPVANTDGYISGAGGSSAILSDIVRQAGRSKYQVKNSQGQGIVQLKTSAAANAAGEATITATDYANCTYYVKKISAHRVTLIRYGSGSFEFGNNTSISWTFGSAETGISVKIDNG